MNIQRDGKKDIMEEALESVEAQFQAAKIDYFNDDSKEQSKERGSLDKKMA